MPMRTFSRILLIFNVTFTEAEIETSTPTVVDAGIVQLETRLFNL
jgi:hypothetical protein